MKWEFNKKNTTYAVYVCGVILFTILCINFLINRDSYQGVISVVKSIFNPILYGLVLAYLLNPILRFFEKLFRKVSKNKLGRKGLRALGLLCAYLLFFLFIGAFLAILLPQLYRSVDDLIDQLIALFNSIPIHLQNLIDSNENFASLYDTLINEFDLVGKLTALTDRIGSLVLSSLSVLMDVFTVVKDLLLGLFFSVYFLASKEMLVGQIKRFFLAFFSFRHNVTLGHFVTTVDTKFGQFIRGKVLDSSIVMLIVYLLTWIFGIPYYPMIALIIGITDLIPVFGPFLGAIPSAAIILIAPDGGFSKTLIFVILILIVQQIDGNIIAPNILGDRVGIGGVWIMIAITTMGGLFGIMGMFFGVPIFAVIYTLVGEAIHKRLVKKGLAEQMDHDGDPPPEEKPGLFTRIKDKLFTKKEASIPVHEKKDEDEDEWIK